MRNEGSGLWPRMRLMVLGLPLVLVGVVLPFLMVLRVLDPTFALSFLGYAASLLGLLLGLVAGMQRDREVR